MKIYFEVEKRQNGAMTITLLKHLLIKQGIEVVSNPENADAIFVSVTDVTYFQVLHQAHKKYKGRIPIVAGGDMTKLDFIQNYADYTVLGEGYNFIESLGKMKNIHDIIDLPNVRTPNKQGIIDNDIKWMENPIIKASSKVFYYYGGKGCPQKCKFCYYSHVNGYSQVDESKIVRALKSIPKGGKLYVTSAYFPYPKMADELLQKLGMIDLKIGMYNKKVYPSRSFRVGIEFFDAETRKLMGKPIPDRQIIELINNSLVRRHEMTTYFMGGIEDEDAMMRFVDIVPEYHRTYSPRIMLHTQYIDFNKGTPLGDVNIRERKDFNRDLLKKELDKKNRRFRVAVVKYKAHSSWRTLLQRTKTFEETEFLYKMKNLKDDSVFMDKVESKYPNLMGTKTIKEVLYGKDKDSGQKGKQA